MHSPSSFDIGTYFNTLGIEEKLDQIIEWNSANSPTQLQYNSDCRSLFESIESVIINTSINRIADNFRYFGFTLDAFDDRTSAKLKGIIESLCGDSMNTEANALQALCYLYTLDAELTEAPYMLLNLREFFLTQIKEGDSLEKGMDMFKQHLRFSETCIEGLADRLQKHIKEKGSSSILSTDEFEETVVIDVNGNQIRFTHPAQVFPVLDLAPMLISATCDPAAKIKQLPKLYDTGKLTAGHLKGDSSDRIAKELLKRFIPGLFDGNGANIIEKRATALNSTTTNYNSQDSTRKDTRSSPCSTEIMDSDLIDKAITKAVEMKLCHESTIDINRCMIDDRASGQVTLFNKIGMFVCRVKV